MGLKMLTVTMSASPTQFTSTDTPCSYVVIQSHPSNSAAIYVGGSATLAATPVGFKMAAPASNVPPDPLVLKSVGPNPINLNQLYVDSGSASQKVTVLYIEE